MQIKPQQLKTFKRWYTVVVLLVIAALLITALNYWGEPASYLFACFAVLAALMLIVTNSVVKQMLPKEKQNKFRNK